MNNPHLVSRLAKPRPRLETYWAESWWALAGYLGAIVLAVLGGAQ